MPVYMPVYAHISLRIERIASKHLHDVWNVFAYDDFARLHGMRNHSVVHVFTIEILQLKLISDFFILMTSEN